MLTFGRLFMEVLFWLILEDLFNLDHRIFNQLLKTWRSKWGWKIGRLRKPQTYVWFAAPSVKTSFQNSRISLCINVVAVVLSSEVQFALFVLFFVQSLLERLLYTWGTLSLVPWLVLFLFIIIDFSRLSIITDEKMILFEIFFLLRQCKFSNYFNFWGYRLWIMIYGYHFRIRTLIY